MNYVLTLPPGKTEAINADGDFFRIVSAALDVEVRIMPGNTRALYGQGDAETMPPGETFRRLEVRNPSAVSTLIVTVYAGFGRYAQQRQAVMEPRTEFDAWSGTQLAATSGETFAGVPAGTRLRRKAIQVTNEDASLLLQVRDEAGHVGLSIKGGDSITLPISEGVEIYNPNGSAVACRISEIWWIA